MLDHIEAVCIESAQNGRHGSLKLTGTAESITIGGCLLLQWWQVVEHWSSISKNVLIRLGHSCNWMRSFIHKLLAMDSDSLSIVRLLIVAHWHRLQLATPITYSGRYIDVSPVVCIWYRLPNRTQSWNRYIIQPQCTREYLPARNGNGRVYRYVTVN